jgi:hypothetical protein
MQPRLPIQRQSQSLKSDLTPQEEPQMSTDTRKMLLQRADE